MAVYSEADRAALHVRLADEAYPFGPAPSRESYLRIDRCWTRRGGRGADAVHPGYGFLAENAAFARACEEAGIVFIGPRSETIALMGEKTSARRLATAAGVPVVPGTLEPRGRRGGHAARGRAHRLPPDAEGGGRRRRQGPAARAACRRSSKPPPSARAARRSPPSATTASTWRSAIDRPRHIEIQVLADHHGEAVHLFERECSIQRRHQKVIEESPSPLLTPELRAAHGRPGGGARARRVGYRNAGTLEFLVDAERNPYFLEMNTRLQVEHPSRRW